MYGNAAIKCFSRPWGPISQSPDISFLNGRESLLRQMECPLKIKFTLLKSAGHYTEFSLGFKLACALPNVFLVNVLVNVLFVDMLFN